MQDLWLRIIVWLVRWLNWIIIAPWKFLWSLFVGNSADDDNEEEFWTPTLRLNIPFNPALSIGPGWTSVESERDKRMAALYEVDFTKVEFTDFRFGDKSIGGKKQLERCRLSGIPLDDRAYIALLAEEGQRTLNWIYENCRVKDQDGHNTEKRIERISFPGAVFRGNNNSEYTLSVYRTKVGYLSSDKEEIVRDRWSNDFRNLNDKMGTDIVCAYIPIQVQWMNTSAIAEAADEKRRYVPRPIRSGNLIERLSEISRQKEIEDKEKRDELIRQLRL